jgi:hypothetical protein
LSTAIPENFSALKFCIFSRFSRYVSIKHANFLCFPGKTNRDQGFHYKHAWKILNGSKVAALKSAKR